MTGKYLIQTNHSMNQTGCKNQPEITHLRLWSILFILFTELFPATIFSQSSNVASGYLEMAGSGGLGSLNYEKNFTAIKNTSLTWSGGLSFAPIDKNNGTGIVFPIMLHSLSGKSAGKLELGIGQGITITTRGHFFILATAAVGYRHQAPDKNFFYRITYTPIVSYLVDFQYQHWAGISFGYSFNKKTP